MIPTSLVSGFRTQKIESAYFDFGFGRQSLLVCRHASRGTELHVTVALNIEAEFFAAMIAAQSPGWPASRRQYERKMGAHHKPPGERPTMLNLRLEVRQSAAVFSNRNGSWALLKKHISPVCRRVKSRQPCPLLGAKGIFCLRELNVS
jgi:hypothetical protein